MISTRGRYAVRVMLDLALQNPNGYTSLESIAKRQNISKKYLESIVRDLVNADLMVGVRGKGGGYKLKRPATEIAVGDILMATEGPLAAVACLQPGASPCGMSGSCLTLPLWRRFDDLVNDFFNGITLQSLLDDAPPLVVLPPVAQE